MNLSDDAKNLALLVAALAIVAGLGYHIGSSGPWRALAQAQEEIILSRNALIQSMKTDIGPQVQQIVADERARFSDAVRLLDNLVSGVEAGDATEALQQAKARLDEWGTSR